MNAVHLGPARDSCGDADRISRRHLDRGATFPRSNSRSRSGNRYCSQFAQAMVGTLRAWTFSQVGFLKYLADPRAAQTGRHATASRYPAEQHHWIIGRGDRHPSKDQPNCHTALGGYGTHARHAATTIQRQTHGWRHSMEKLIAHEDSPPPRLADL